MTRIRRLIHVDDLDRRPYAEGDGESVRFGLDGVEYEIDLADAHARDLRRLLARYVAAARPLGPPVAPRNDLDDVRTWARRHGYVVSPSEPIPWKVLDAWRAARFEPRRRFRPGAGPD